jgi:hypothetical protein
MNQGMSPLAAVFALLFCATFASQTQATDPCADGGIGCPLQPRLQAQIGSFDARAAISDLGTKGFTTTVSAVRQQASGDPARSPGIPNSRSAPIVANGYCWHDDYAFLPAGARSGISCDSQSTAASPDPHRVALSILSHMDLPDLRIDMNPRLGMVAVPTWFWVEGYRGDVIPMSATLRLPRQRCHSVANRDASGSAELGSDGSPSTHSSCTTDYDTLTVQVRAWPRSFHWDFGDSGSQTIACPELSACTAGLGLPYTDSSRPSPIAHSYRWSSLGVNGAADAYRIDLTIVFGAQYRFSINGQSGNGWQSLGDHELGWTAGQRVQEAQSVLTRSCAPLSSRC